MADYIWKSILTEFLGTFFLVFVGAGTVALTAAQGGSVIASAFAFGLTLMVLFYSWGSFSGAHFNPATSFGFALAGRMNWLLMLGYWVAQLVAGITAGALIAYLFGTATGAGASIGVFTNTDAWKAVLLEGILTLLLVVTILLVTRSAALSIVSGLVIGMVLAANMFVGYYWTGASMNPARSLGPAIFSNNMGTYWIYVVGPLVGALIAALVFKLFDMDWSCRQKMSDCGEPMFDTCGNKILECDRTVVDTCGKGVVTACGNGKEKEKYTKVEHKQTHHQATLMSEAGQWMSEHGMSPQYLGQQASKAMRQVDGAVTGALPGLGALRPGAATPMRSPTTMSQRATRLSPVNM